MKHIFMKYEIIVNFVLYNNLESIFEIISAGTILLAVNIMFHIKIRCAINTDQNIQCNIFIVDCYNASPESMAAGLAVLMQTAKARSRRPVAVLGDMLELGSVSESAHKNVGKTAAMLGIKRLFTFGKAAVHIAKGAMEAGMPADAVTIIENTEDAEGAAKCIGEQIKKEDAILFKASRGIALERVIKFL